MKKINFIILSLSFILFSCKNSDDDTSPTEVITDGKWKISYYEDRNKIETSNYSNFEFDFSSSGEITATLNGTVHKGTYQFGVDDSKDKMVISFLPSSLLEEISDDWEIINKTESKIELYHVSGGDGHTSTLIFVKL